MSRRSLTEPESRAAARLKAAYKKSGLTQDEIAEKTGMTQSGFGHYVNARIPLNLDALFSICPVIKANPVRIYYINKRLKVRQ